MGHWTSFFKKSFTLGVYNVIIQILNFATFTIVARFLTSEEYGIIALITVFSGFLIIFSDSGITYAVVREDFNEFFLRKLATLALLIGFFLSLTLAILSYPISIFYQNPLLFLPTISLSTIFFINALFLIPKACLQKTMEFNKMSLYMLLGQLVNGGLTIFMAVYGFSYWSLVLPQIIGSLLQAYLFLRIHKVYPILISYGEIKSTFFEVRLLIGSISGYNLVNYWARNSDNLLIAKFFGEAQLGIYNYAYKLFYLPNNILNNVLSQIVLPSFKTLKDSNGNVQKEYLKLIGLLSVSLMPLGYIFILLAEPLVLLLFGSKWIAIKDILPFFGVALLTQPLVSPISILLVLYKKERELAKIGLVNSVILIGFITLGVLFSIKHLVFFYTLSYLLLTLPIIIFYGLYLKLNFNMKDLLFFWIPKMLFSTIIVLGLWYNHAVTIYNGVFFYLILLLIFETKNLKNLASVLKKKLVR